MSEHINETGIERFSRLLRIELSQRGLKPEPFSKVVGATSRTVENWLGGHRKPTPTSHGAIERALGWKAGSIEAMFDESPFQTVHWDLDEVRLPDPEKQPVARAAELSDDELLTEVTRRFKTYADKAMSRPNDRTVVLEDERENYDIAARKTARRNRKKPTQK